MISKLVAFAQGTRQQPQTSGQKAEAFAARYLAKQGIRIVTTNYLCRGGEIDIIASHNNTLVFVEVRLRNNPRFATGMESISAAKQRKLHTAATTYLQEKFQNHQPPCRFDVISLKASNDAATAYTVDWIQDAFRPEY